MIEDENDKLSEQNEVITLDMQSFKMEYEEKLHDIRDQLDRVTHEPLPIVAMAEEKGKVNDTTSSDSNAQQLIAAYQVALERAKTKEQRNSERRMTLEKTIFGLLERYKMVCLSINPRYICLYSYLCFFFILLVGRRREEKRSCSCSIAWCGTCRTCHTK